MKPQRAATTVNVPSSDLVVIQETFEGPGRFFVSPATRPRAQLFLGHGAGGGVDAVDLSVLAGGLPERGVTVVRFEQPWRTAGGRVAVRPPRLDAAWNDALGAVLDETVVLPGVSADLPLFCGGRSAGARVACRTAAVGVLAGAVTGVVACAFPLHPPGRPDRSRAFELLAPQVPRLVLQGGRDSFGTAEDVQAAISAESSAESSDKASDESSADSNAETGTAPDVHVVAVPDADHSMRLAKAAVLAPAQLRQLLIESVLAFVDGLVPRQPGNSQARPAL